MKNKIEYTLNVLLYFYFVWEIWSNKKIEKIFDCVLFKPIDVFVGIFNKKHTLLKRNEQRKKSQQYQNLMIRSGLSINMAKYSYIMTVAFYSIGLSVILLTVITPCFGWSKYIIIGILLGGTVVALNFCERYVFNNNKYLSYFKKFEDEDTSWRHKWARYTFYFFIGGFATMFGGIAFLILFNCSSTI